MVQKQYTCTECGEIYSETVLCSELFCVNCGGRVEQNDLTTPNKTMAKEGEKLSSTSQGDGVTKEGIMPNNKTQYKQSSIPSVFLHRSYLVRRYSPLSLYGPFHIYDPSGRVAFYSILDEFKNKDIRLYTGEDMRTEVLSIQARQIIGFSAAYDVIDSSINMKVGALKGKGEKSLVKDEWIIMDAEDREIGFIKEDSMTLALIRCFWRFINWWDVELPSLLPQKYYGELKREQVCVFKQNFNPFALKINLDYSMDHKQLLDRRLGIAGAVLLCAIKGTAFTG